MKNKRITKILLLLFAFSIQTGAIAQRIGPNYIVFEAEDTESDLGFWKLRTPEDQLYCNPSNGMAPIHNTHLEFTGNNEGTGPATSPLEYKFVCPKTGSYKLGGRLFQRLEGAENDKCNDVYVKMSGNFTSGHSSVTVGQLRTNYKFVGRGVNRWGAMYKIEINHEFPKAIYNFIEGEEYTLTVSGRSKRCNVDYWLIYETVLPINIGANIDLATNNDEKYLPNPTDSNLSLLESSEKIRMNIHPNPVANQFTITNSMNYGIAIYDISGRLMMRSKVKSNSEFIDISSFNTGVYFIQLENKGKVTSRKIIKN